MKPILKYRGGKSKEYPLYKDYIPTNFETYYEPFLGGGATFFALEPKKAYISDINTYLMNFYEEIQKDYYQVKKELKELQDIYEKNRETFISNKKANPNERVFDPNEPLYYELRKQFNGMSVPEYTFATLYYFINKTAYSGMIRYNSKGEFNVPYGRYANFNTELLNDNHFNLLQNDITIKNSTYKDSFELATKDDFIFLDPPYDTVFTSYGNEEFTGDFGEEEHRILANDFKNLSSPALMIISETKLIEELYREYIQDKYPISYSVNIRNRFKSKANHLVIANYNIFEANSICNKGEIYSG